MANGEGDINNALGSIQSIWTKIKGIANRLQNTSKYTTSTNEARDINKLFEEYTQLEKKLATNPELIESAYIQQFLKEHFPNIKMFFVDHKIIYNGEGFEILSKELSGKLIEKTKEGREKKLEYIIVPVPFEETQLYEKYASEEKFLPKNISSIVNQLDNNIKSLVGLSVSVEESYIKNQELDAEEYKYSIYKRYDKAGQKFCNLYIRGYLKTLFSRIYDKQSAGETVNITEELSIFVNSKANAIFFMHPYITTDEISETASTIRNFISENKSYVAIHSLGSGNKSKARRVIEHIGQIDESLYTIKIIDEKRGTLPWEYSKIWYQGDEGRGIFSMIS